MWFDADKTPIRTEVADLIDDAIMLGIRVFIYSAIALMIAVASGVQLPWLGL